MRLKYFLTVIFLIGLAWGCREETPLNVDGNSSIKLVAIWDTSTVEGVNKYVPLAGAKVILNSEYGTFVRYMDNEGKISIANIPASKYDIAVRMPHPLDPNIIIVGNIKEVNVLPKIIFKETINGMAVNSSRISINEFYACGQQTNIYIFYEKYIDSYTSSDRIK